LDPNHRGFIDETVDADPEMKAGSDLYKKERDVLFSNPISEVSYRTKHQYEKAMDNAVKKAKKAKKRKGTGSGSGSALTESKEEEMAKEPKAANSKKADKLHEIVNLEDSFNAQDGNDDGKLTKEEINSWAKTQEDGGMGDIPDADFKSLDTDSDGFISKKEFMILEGAVPAAKSADEMERHRDRMAVVFDEQDANSDGLLTMDEVNKYASANSANGSPMGDIPTEEFDKIDSDKDGKWSKEEFLALSSE
jgi:Ca2+-binding EF-hand superfamily protein